MHFLQEKKCGFFIYDATFLCPHTQSRVFRYEFLGRQLSAHLTPTIRSRKGTFTECMALPKHQTLLLLLFISAPKPSSAEVKNEWSYTSALHLCLHNARTKVYFTLIQTTPHPRKRAVRGHIYCLSIFETTLNTDSSLVWLLFYIF